MLDSWTLHCWEWLVCCERCILWFLGDRPKSAVLVVVLEWMRPPARCLCDSLGRTETDNGLWLWWSWWDSDQQSAVPYDVLWGTEIDHRLSLCEGLAREHQLYSWWWRHQRQEGGGGTSGRGRADRPPTRLPFSGSLMDSHSTPGVEVSTAAPAPVCLLPEGYWGPHISIGSRDSEIWSSC